MESHEIFGQSKSEMRAQHKQNHYPPKTIKNIPLSPKQYPLWQRIFYLWPLNFVLQKAKVSSVNDLWQIPEECKAENCGHSFTENWRLQVDISREYLTQQKPSSERTSWRFWKCLHRSYSSAFYIAAFIELLSYLVGVIQPLNAALLLNYIEFKTRENSQDQPDETFFAQFSTQIFLHPWAPLLLAGIFLIIEVSVSLFSTHYRQWMLEVHGKVRSSLRSQLLTLSSRARQSYSVGEIANLLDRDIGRLEGIAWTMTSIWQSPLEILTWFSVLYFATGLVPVIFCIITFAVAGPLHTKLSTRIDKLWDKVRSQDDKILKRLLQYLQNIRVLKMFALEKVLHNRLEKIRSKLDLTQSQAVSLLGYSDGLTSVIPLVIIVFVFTWKVLALQEKLTASNCFLIIFALNNLSGPLEQLARLASELPGYMRSARSLEQFFLMEEIQKPSANVSDPNFCIELNNCSFEWSSIYGEGEGVVDNKKEDSNKEDNNNKTKEDNNNKTKEDNNNNTKEDNSDKQEESDDEEPQTGDSQEGSENSGPASATESDSDDEDEEKEHTIITQPALTNISLRIKKGSFVVVLGKIGSGKSSLLSSLLGDIHKTAGDIRVSGSIAYCSQLPFIKNATVKENILFGASVDIDKYNSALERACLTEDLRHLPNGDQTLIGEKGVNLSGGQKQRISVARAFYQNRDIYLFDDPLASLDPNVGMKVLHAICDLKEKTRVLVTHNAVATAFADRVIVLQNGSVAVDVSSKEFANLPEFQELFSEGSSISTENLKQSQNEAQENSENESEETESDENGLGDDDLSSERTMKNYLAFGRIAFASSKKFFVLTLLFSLLNQIFQEGAQVWAGFWIDLPSDHSLKGNVPFLAIFSSLLLLAAAVSFAREVSENWLGTLVGAVLHSKMITALFRAPVSFFDQTPIGKISKRFSSDHFTASQMLITTWNHIVIYGLNLIFDVLPLTYLAPLPFFGVLVPIVIMIVKFFVIYQKKHLLAEEIESNTDNPVVSNFSETVLGCSTIRAYGLESFYVSENDQLIDSSWRSTLTVLHLERFKDFYVSVTVTFGLAISVFYMASSSTSSLLTAGIAALVLNHQLSFAGNLSLFLEQFSDLDMQMNSFDRINKFLKIKSENYEGSVQVPQAWPQKGHISFQK